MKWLNEKEIVIERELSELDKFIIKFLKAIKNSKYAVVSGYVSILFGRARGTEDIDIIIEPMSKQEFKKFFRNIKAAGFWCINADSDEAYSMLKDGLAVRIARSNEIIPNIELKFCKNGIEEEAISNAVKVVIGNKHMFISPLELQIAYKEVVLSSEKDIEDAMHLKAVLGNKIDKKKLEYYRKTLRGLFYGSKGKQG